MRYWLGLILLLIVAIILIAPRLARRQQRNELADAIEQFRVRREALEAKFFDLAGSIGKPRGLRWKECDWQSEVQFVKDRASGLLTAFVSVEIHFEAIEGEDMEDVAAVGDIRDGSAVFHYENGNWGTGGKALFNMNPATAVEMLQHQFEVVNVDGPAGSAAVTNK